MGPRRWRPQASCLARGTRWRVALSVCLGRALVSSAEVSALSGSADADGSCSAEGGAAECAASDGAGATGPSCGCGALKRSDFATAGSTVGSGESAETAPVLEYGGAGETEEEAGVIYLDGGTFTMGLAPSDEGDPTISPLDGESPPHEETVGPYGLGKYEVSNKRFAKFVEATGYVTEAEKFGWSFGVEAFLSKEVSEAITKEVTNAPWWLPVDGADWRHPNGVDTSIADVMDHPATQISFADAQAFCAWSRPGGRVPTEPEWEYAARGGRKRSRFPWGNNLLTGANKDKHRMNIWQSDLDARLVHPDGTVNNVYGYGEHAVELAKQYYSRNNTALDGYKGTAPVNAFGPQNVWGFHNIVGNVWEWTASHWTTSDPNAPPVDPNALVKKGGSFLCNAATCNRYRCSARMMFTTDSAASNVGFRCAYPGRPAGSRHKAKDRPK